MTRWIVIGLVALFIALVVLCVNKAGSDADEDLHYKDEDLP